jgi:hypothetical protein
VFLCENLKQNKSVHLNPLGPGLRRKKFSNVEQAHNCTHANTAHIKMSSLSSFWRYLSMNRRRRARRKQERHIPVPIDEIEEYRQRGQSILRAMLTPQVVVVDSPIISTSISEAKGKKSSLSSPSQIGTTVHDPNSMHRCISNENMIHTPTSRQDYDVDWVAVIQKANELHQEEQERLREKKSSCNNSPKVKRLKQLKRALEKRRRYDQSGSFSINMLTYRTEDDTQPMALPPGDRHVRDKLEVNFHQHNRRHHHHNHHHQNQSSDTSSTSSAASDDRSRSCEDSAASTKSIGAMHIIEESYEYQYSYDLQQQKTI